MLGARDTHAHLTEIMQEKRIFSTTHLHMLLTYLVKLLIVHKVSIMQEVLRCSLAYWGVQTLQRRFKGWMGLLKEMRHYCAVACADVGASYFWNICTAAWMYCIITLSPVVFVLIGFVQWNNTTASSFSRAGEALCWYSPPNSSHFFCLSVTLWCSSSLSLSPLLCVCRYIIQYVNILCSKSRWVWKELSDDIIYYVLILLIIISFFSFFLSTLFPLLGTVCLM